MEKRLKIISTLLMSLIALSLVGSFSLTTPATADPPPPATINSVHVYGSSLATITWTTYSQYVDEGRWLRVTHTKLYYEVAPDGVNFGPWNLIADINTVTYDNSYGTWSYDYSMNTDGTYKFEVVPYGDYNWKGVQFWDHSFSPAISRSVIGGTSWIMTKPPPNTGTVHIGQTITNQSTNPYAGVAVACYISHYSENQFLGYGNLSLHIAVQTAIKSGLDPYYQYRINEVIIQIFETGHTDSTELTTSNYGASGFVLASPQRPVSGEELALMGGYIVANTLFWHQFGPAVGGIVFLTDLLHAATTIFYRPGAPLKETIGLFDNTGTYMQYDGPNPNPSTPATTNGTAYMDAQWRIYNDFSSPSGIQIKVTVMLAAFGTAPAPDLVTGVSLNFKDESSSLLTFPPVGTTPPSFTSKPGNIIRAPGQPFTLSWTPTDTQCGSSNYEIRLGSSVVAKGPWAGDQAITYSGSQTAAGTYTYTCTVSDIAGKSASDESTVTIPSPTAIIVSPSDNQNFFTAQASTSITVQVQASDPVAPVIFVEIQCDGGVWQAAAYNSASGYWERTFTVSAGYPSGTPHTFTAGALDNYGNEGFSATCTIYMQQVKPTAVIVNPLHNQNILTNQTSASVRVQVNASDPVVPVTGVQIQCDTGSWQTATYNETSGFWEYTFGLSAGYPTAMQHNFIATASDAYGNTGSDTISVSVQQVKPIAVIVNPLNNQNILTNQTSASVKVQVQASVNVGSITGVQLQCDKGGWQTASYNSTSGYWEYIFSLTAGYPTAIQHNFTARASDGSGNTGYSATISVNVTQRRFTVTVTIQAYPTTDRYLRYHGMSVDQPLPWGWWNYPGYNIKTTSSKFTYSTQLVLASGSHYIVYGNTGYAHGNPSYAWHAKIFINGVLVAEGDVGRDQYLTAYFTV